VAALLSECNSLDVVGPWCAEHRGVLARRYPHARFLTPSGALFRWLLPRLSVAEFERALAGWVRRSGRGPAREALALDGKTVRGAALTQPDGSTQAPQLLSVSGHQSQETVIPVRVDGKTKEIPVAWRPSSLSLAARPGGYRRRLAHPDRLRPGRARPGG
jgi:hypothetical protein